MKVLLLGLALFSSMTQAATVCYKSDIFAISQVKFTIKDNEQNVLSSGRYNDLMITHERCVQINEYQHSVTVNVTHLTGLVWEPVANTCDFENIRKNTRIVAHGTTLNYYCTVEDL